MTQLDTKPPDLEATPSVGAVAGPEPSVVRLRLLLISLGLTLLVFAQSAGNTSTDTKFDLVVSPLRFLGRAVKLWDPVGGAGQLQNQAYGYLFPMGPFFALFHAIGTPAWETQRLWETLIIVAAFLGTYRLSGALGVRRFWPQVAAGLVYALAPRSLSELTTISSELMPVAALPWVLTPLVRGARDGSPRRAAMRSGVALLFAGGVNAAATLAILPIPALWLLTRSRGPRRRQLMTWWAAAVALACCWWAIPLVLLGRYSPPFLDWIESASTTTLPTSMLASLRGVDHWEQYLGSAIWPAGWIFASAPATIVATSVVAGAGLSGLARRESPHRLFLVSCLLLGLIFVTAGHASPVAPPWTGSLRGMLDTSLVAFRNLHKFDPLIRLPIAIGVGHALAMIGDRLPRASAVQVGRNRVTLPVRAFAVVAVAGIALVAISPALSNRVVTSQRITSEPGWWQQAGRWLAAHSEDRRALVVPASTSPVYVWGGTVDNALQPVAESPWTTRDSVPLAEAGYIRLLDQIGDRLAAGTGDPDLAALLTRAGIGYVVLANDLNAYSSGSTPLFLHRTTLASSPGFSVVQSFGPDVGGSLLPSNRLDGGEGVPRPSIQIYAVAGDAHRADLDPLASAVRATGSADNLESLVAQGLDASTPVFFGADADGLDLSDSPAAVTDGIRKREATFGGLLAKSPTMTAEEPYRSTRPVHDYLPDNAGKLSAYEYTGISDLQVSSTGDALLALVNRSPINGPWSALDSDPSTAWESSSFSGAVGQWLQVDFAQALSTPTVTVDFKTGIGSLPSKVSVTTEGGTIVDDVVPLGGSQTIKLPAGSTRALRITVAAVADGGHGSSVGISTLNIPGITPGRTLQVPAPAGPVDRLTFRASSGYRPTCLAEGESTFCDDRYQAAGEEDAGIDRSVTLTDGAEYVPTATVRLRGGTALDAALDAGAAVTATATSVYSDDPRQRPGAAVDGDPTTAWQAGAGDQQPTLTLDLGQPRTVRGVTLTASTASGVAAPTRVLVTAGAQSWTGTLPSDGRIVFSEPASAAKVTIKVLVAQVVNTTDTLTLRTRLVPVGLSDVQVDADGLGAPSRSDAPVTLDCAAGVVADIDGRQVAMQVSADRADVLASAPVKATACDTQPVELAAGPHRFQLLSTTRTLPVSFTLDPPGDAALPAAPSPGTMAIRTWDATHRTVVVDTTSAAVLAVHENYNVGWEATLDGHRLRAVRVDGWQQAFVVPAGSHGTITLVFAPQRPFEIGLVIGAVAVIGLFVLAFFRPRRVQVRAADPLVDGVLHRLLLGALAAAAGYVLAGLWGVGGAVVVLAAAAALGQVRRGVPWWAPAALVTLAGLLVGRANKFEVFNEQNSLLAQVLCVIAVLAAAFGSERLSGRQGRDP